MLFKYEKLLLLSRSKLRTSSYPTASHWVCSFDKQLQLLFVHILLSLWFYLEQERVNTLCISVGVVGWLFVVDYCLGPLGQDYIPAHPLLLYPVPWAIASTFVLLGGGGMTCK